MLEWILDIGRRIAITVIEENASTAMLITDAQPRNTVSVSIVIILNS
jgi:hypothetical protein